MAAGALCCPLCPKKLASGLLPQWCSGLAPATTVAQHSQNPFLPWALAPGLQSCPGQFQVQESLLVCKL